jgi:hypothetical protein
VFSDCRFSISLIVKEVSCSANDLAIAGFVPVQPLTGSPLPEPAVIVA